MRTMVPVEMDRMDSARMKLKTVWAREVFETKLTQSWKLRCQAQCLCLCAAFARHPRTTAASL